MKVKSIELEGLPLDWAVAVAEGATDLEYDGNTFGFKLGGELKVLAKGWAPSMCWSPSRLREQAGEIIEREGIGTWQRPEWPEDQRWSALIEGLPFVTGPNLRVAAMRCYVRFKLGEEVEIPDRLWLHHARTVDSEEGAQRAERMRGA